jgi:hypothetical protein
MTEPTDRPVTTITLIVHEETGQVGLNRCGLFTGTLANGDVIVTRSRTPFLDAARILLAEGLDPSTILQMVHKHTGTPSLRGPIGVAAKLTVDEIKSPRFRPYRPFPKGIVEADGKLNHATKIIPGY